MTHLLHVVSCAQLSASASSTITAYSLHCLQVLPSTTAATSASPAVVQLHPHHSVQRHLQQKL
jgi:hypothetical protein